MKQLICLSHIPFKKVPNRTQYLLRHLQDVEVLFFEPAPERAVRHDPRIHNGERLAPHTFVYTFPATLLALESEYRSERRVAKKLGRYLDECLRFHRVRRPILWVTSPIYACLTDEVSNQGLVYDCFEDFSDLPILWESQLTYRADVVFAASPNLAHRLSPCNDNIAIVPNGINTAFYNRAYDETLPYPRDLRELGHPVFGYTGTIWRNLNLEPVLAAAKAHPEWQFVLIGTLPEERNPLLPRLNRMHNVTFLGHRPKKLIPAYINHFDVCFSLQRNGMEDNDILSPRVYEYLATGRPIVSMYHHLHQEEYPYLIESAYSPARFVDACEKMIAQSDQSKQIQRRDAAQQADWSCRCEQVERILRSNGLLGDLPPAELPFSQL